MKITEIFLALDLEMNQPSGKIIMIGACIGNTGTGEILETLRCYVKIDEPISPYITTLTNISEDDLESKGISLQEAYLELKKMHSKHDASPMVIQWGDGDVRKLKQDLFPNGILPKDWIFGYRAIDVKTVYQSFCIANAMKLQSGLAKSLTKMGLRFIGTKHDACDDAINTFKIFFCLLGKFK